MIQTIGVILMTFLMIKCQKGAIKAQKKASKWRLSVDNGHIKVKRDRRFK